MFTIRSAAPTLRRGYAAAANAKKATLQLESLPGKYATAAFNGALSKSQQTLSQVEADLNSIQKLIESKDKSTIFLANPTLSSTERASELKNLLSKVSKPSEITANLLDALSSNGRLTTTAEVVREFSRLVKHHKGEVEITVTSAEALDKSVQQQLEKSLKASEYVQGKSMRIVNKVQPSILGGIILDFNGEKTIDLSAVSKVQKLNGLLAASV